MSRRPPVRAWLLLGPKAGDNTQVQALGNALTNAHGFNCEPRRLQFRRTELLTNLLLGPNLAGLAPGADALEPPWPDVVITAGRRNEPVARWIRRASGDHSRLVHIGRPWALPHRFDLIISTPQYTLPAADNVLTLPLPLLPPAPAASETCPELPWAHLPRPHLAVLVGGNSGAFRFTAATGQALGEAVLVHARELGASILVTTSPRTPAATAAALFSTLTGAGQPLHLFDWHHNEGMNNPYREYLAHADAFVVTGESASMLAEAVGSGKPVAIFDPPRTRRGAWRWRPLTFYLGQWLGPRRMRRHIERLHQQVIDAGYAQRLGVSPKPGSATPFDAAGALALAAQRVAELA